MKSTLLLVLILFGLCLPYAESESPYDNVDDYIKYSKKLREQALPKLHEKASQNQSLTAETEKQILSLAQSAVMLLKEANVQGFGKVIHPEKGVRFTPYGHIDPTTDRVFTSDEISRSTNDSKKYSWGQYDGKDDAIVMTFSEYVKSFVFDHDYTQAGISINGNRPASHPGEEQNNYATAYPNAVQVEFYLKPSRPDALDWSALRLFVEPYNGSWYIVGIAHAVWTI